MLTKKFENPGALFLGVLFSIPFVFYGLGLASLPYLAAGLILLTYTVLILLNFEVGFLGLIFIRSSLDYMKNFNEGAVNLAGLISLLLIVLGVFYVLYRRVNILHLEDSKPFLAFVAICGFSVFYSADVMSSFQDFLRLLSVFSVYVLTRLIFITEKKIKTAFLAILLSALIPVALGFYQLATGNGTVEDAGQQRIVGAFLHPNAFASYLLIILIFCMGQVFEGTYFINKALMRAILVPTFIIFVFTLSRGAWIVFILAMVLMGIMRYKKILAVIPPLLLVAVAFIPAVQDRILNVFEPGHYAAGRSAWDWRLDTWEEIGGMVESKPILGHGLSTVETQFGILTHNDYLRLLAEVGIVGLFLYIALALFIWKKTWSNYKRTESPLVKSIQVGLIAMIAAFLVREFADNTLRNTVVMMYFWAFIALERNLTLLHLNEDEGGRELVRVLGYDEAEDPNRK